MFILPKQLTRMKKQILTSLIALGAAYGACASPAWVSFDNVDNAYLNPASAFGSTNHGLIFVYTGFSVVPLTQDINVELLGGPSAGSLSPMASLTFANGTAQGDAAQLDAPGVFLDLSGTVYNVPGLVGGETAFLEVNAWLGNDATYVAALSDGSPSGTSGVYQSPTGGIFPVNGFTNAYPPVSIGDSMPSFLVTNAPEPTTLAFGGLGAATLLLLRRKE
jgi:hypothetical protein